jgi:hypothetical protein
MQDLLWAGNPGARASVQAGGYVGFFGQPGVKGGGSGHCVHANFADRVIGNVLLYMQQM